MGPCSAYASHYGHQREGQDTLLSTSLLTSLDQTSENRGERDLKNSKGHVCTSHGKYDRHVWPVVKVMIAIVLHQMNLIRGVI